MAEVLERSGNQEGPFPSADRVAAAADGPQYELHSVLHSLDDLAPQDKAAPRQGGLLTPLLITFLSVAALIGFVAGLLLSPPLPR